MKFHYIIFAIGISKWYDKLITKLFLSSLCQFFPLDTKASKSKKWPWQSEVTNRTLGIVLLNSWEGSSFELTLWNLDCCWSGLVSGVSFSPSSNTSRSKSFSARWRFIPDPRTCNGLLVNSYFKSCISSALSQVFYL